MKVEHWDALLTHVEKLYGLDASAGPEAQGWICEWGLSREEEIHCYDSALYGSKMPIISH